MKSNELFHQNICVLFKFIFKFFYQNNKRIGTQWLKVKKKTIYQKTKKHNAIFKVSEGEYI